MKEEYYIGKKYNRWTIISLNHRKPDNWMKVWNCICDCGTRKTVLQQQLTNGSSKSCGCLRNEIVSKRLKETPIHTNSKSFGESNFNHLFREYREGAKRRKIEFNLDENSFKKLSKQNCFYCGIEPKQIMNHPRSNGEYIYNGIDRYINSKGYDIKNCVSCCGICNKMKMDLDGDIFLKKIQQVYLYNIKNSQNT